jgi:two-component system nitrogen regulation response regulator GlnG
VSAIVANSDKMGPLLRHMRATAQSDKPTLMLGASGSGRSFLGKRIHDMSPRKDKPLVEISCLEPLLSEGLIASAERARGGTLLVTDLDRLDEHGQRELRCLLAKCSEWDRPPRLVTTALPELEVRAKRGLFMRSLYDQVAVLRHRIPSLYERLDDLPELCRLLLAEHSHTEDRAAPALLARRTCRTAQLRLAGQRPRAVQHPAASAAVVRRSHRRRGSLWTAVRRDGTTG